MTQDLRIESHGTLVLVVPLTKLGHQAISAVTESNSEAITWGETLVVEPRYVNGLLAQLADDFGLSYGESES